MKTKDRRQAYAPELMTGGVVIALDVSGAMPEDVRDAGIDIARKTALNLGAEQATYITFDAMIENLITLPIKERRPLKNLNLGGRGGTDYRCIFERCRKFKSPVKFLFIISDLTGLPTVSYNPDMMVVWIDVSDLPHTVPTFGVHVMLKKLDY